MQKVQNLFFMQRISSKIPFKTLANIHLWVKTVANAGGTAKYNWQRLSSQGNFTSQKTLTMKTQTKITSILLFTVLSFAAVGQNSKPSIAVLSIDAKGLNTDRAALTSMARTELEKLDTFEVIDKYETEQYIQKNNLTIGNCYGKTCLTEVGAQLKSDKMFSGSMELVGKSIILTFRLFDVERKEIEKTYVGEFLNIQEEIQNMLKLAMSEMFNRPFDKNLMTKLSKRYAFDNSVNNPNVERLALDGPRMGFVTYSGEMNKIMSGAKSNGGFDLFPAMFQFGYQFERQYLNEGNIQALFEVIPLISGLDQGYCLPSLTLLHGVRSNVSGWEFGFGPSFNITKIAKGYYDDKGAWNLQSAWHENGANAGLSNPYETKERLDSRGFYKLESTFILVAGKTFKSGRLNVPCNFFVIPGRYGWKFGVSFGFNGKSNR